MSYRAQVEALVREIFRRTGHWLPDSLAIAPVLHTMTLTAVFAQGSAVVGGGEDVAHALQSATQTAGAKWVADGGAATHTVIILTGALLASPALVAQVFPCNAHRSPSASLAWHCTTCAGVDCSAS